MFVEFSAISKLCFNNCILGYISYKVIKITMFYCKYIFKEKESNCESNNNMMLNVLFVIGSRVNYFFRNCVRQ